MFDQIIRDIVYTMVAYAGMPKQVLNAYKDYLENLKLQNCLAGGSVPPIQEDVASLKDALSP